MRWTNLLPIAIRELRRSAAGQLSIKPDGRPRTNDQALFVMEFVDSRYLLQALYGTYVFNRHSGDPDTPSGGDAFKDSAGNTVVGGSVIAAYNMIAETPIAFEAQTVKITSIYPPSVGDIGFGCFEGDPNNAASISAANVPVSNQATAPTYVQTVWSYGDIIGQLAGVAYGLSKGRVSVSAEIFDAVLASADYIVDDGDLINLDFRSMTVAAALDAFAQRLGAVWIWDRTNSCLVLHLNTSNYSLFDIPEYPEWLMEMEPHRVSGYINSLTLDVPRTIIVSHEAAYCSEIGPYRYDDNGDAVTLDELLTYVHLVDHRSITTDGGFVSTKYTTGLNTRAPMIWQCSDSVPQHLTVDVKDHIPALIGTRYVAGYPIVDYPGSFTDTRYKYRKVAGSPILYYGIGELGGSPAGITNTVQSAPWNYDAALTFSMAFTDDVEFDPYVNVPTDQGSDNPRRLRVRLQSRKAIYEARFFRLQGVIDGDITTNRMPPVYWDERSRAHTPSVGLQYDDVNFGAAGSHTVTYRIYGKNTHPLLYPQGAHIARLAGGANVHAFQTNGTQTITVRKREANNIKRAFLCRFSPHRQLNSAGGTNPDGLGYLWLYKFSEVTPESNAATMLFSQQDATGFTVAQGYALNICEMTYRDVPTQGWDGGILNFRDRIGDIPQDTITPSAPNGYAICYEIYNRSGFTSYYIFAPNGINVTCAPPPSSAMPPSWPFMGISGVAKTNNNQIVGDIMGA